MFTFTDNVPPATGRSTIDPRRAEEVADACIDNPGEWARVPITYLYPDIEGADEKKLVTKCRNLAGNITTDKIAPFNQYKTEARARGTDIYIRIVLTQRQRRELTE